MKLSEAIRLGAMMKPQGRFDFYKDGRTCALGAALDAIGKLVCRSDRDEAYLEADAAFPILESLIGPQQYPSGCEWTSPSKKLSLAIWLLNDGHGWTREQIADWVETIEAQHKAKADVADRLQPVTTE